MQTAFGWAKSTDFSSDRVRIGLSGGINSAAMLCFMGTIHPAHCRPKWIGLYYAHLQEHSPDTFRFVADCVRWARLHFPAVSFGMHRTSAINYFERIKFIPHPTVSPCTWTLKIEPMEAWDQAHGVTIDLLGFVREEMIRRGEKHIRSEADLARFPISGLSDEDCFRLVDQEIGWHPAIYDIRGPKGKRLFTHNNCLPCKNMTARQMESVRVHFPERYRAAVEMAQRIGNHWGRKGEEIGDPCSACRFD